MKPVPPEESYWASPHRTVYLQTISWFGAVAQSELLCSVLRPVEKKALF